MKIAAAYFKNTQSAFTALNGTSSPRKKLLEGSKAVGFAAAETLVLLPRLVVGKEASPLSIKQMRHSSHAELGLLGSATYYAAEICRLAGGSVGLVASLPFGLVASLASLLVGSKKNYFPDICLVGAHAGSHLAAAVLTLVVAAEEILRSSAASILALAVEQLGAATGALGQSLNHATMTDFG